MKNMIYDAESQKINIGDLCTLKDEHEALNGEVVSIETIVTVESNGSKYKFKPEEIVVMPF